jgi:hypothetical protein
MSLTLRKAFIFGSLTLTASVLTACSSLFGGGDVKIRPVENLSGRATEQHDTLYESAVSAINAHDYGRALDYLHEARSRDPHNVKALNALGVVYDKLGRFDLSARYYAEARAVEPGSEIVAKNMGYSKMLQGLIDPGVPTAVATVDLPPAMSAVPPEKQPAKVETAAAARGVTNSPVEHKQTMIASAIRVVINAAVPKITQRTVVELPPVTREVPPEKHPAKVETAAAARGVTNSPVEHKQTMIASAIPVVINAAIPKITQRTVVELPPVTREVPPEKEPAKVETAAAAQVVTNNTVDHKQTMMAPAIPVVINPGVPKMAGPAVPHELAQPLPIKKKVLTIGRPVKILNASGKADRVGTISHRLTMLGWTVRQFDFNGIQPLTTLYYPAQTAFVAKAMQRTLPFPVRLMQNADGASSVRLVVGRDYLSWRPPTGHLKALWQRGATVASLQKISIRGVR